MHKILSKSGVKTIPGIGAKYAERLKSIGIRTPLDLVSHFKRLDNNAQQFQNWIKHSCRAYSNHAKMVYSALEEINVAGNKPKPIRHGPMKVSSKEPVSKTEPNLVPHNSRRNFASANFAINHRSESFPALIKFDDKIGVKVDTKGECTDDMPKVREQFLDQLNKANRNLLKLQNEFGKLHHMSMEIDGLMDASKSSNKVVDLKRIEKSMEWMKKRIEAITRNQEDLAALIFKMDSRNKQQLEENKTNFESMLSVLGKVDTQLGQLTEDTEANKAMKDDFEVALSNQTNSMVYSIILGCIVNFCVLVAMVH